MALFTFKLPDIGEGIAEAEIVAWHVKPGDMIAEDQPIADMMTDKATVEMESPVAGKVIEIAGEIGDVVSIGAMLVVIETEGSVEERIDAETPDAGTVEIVEAAEIAPEPFVPSEVEAPAPTPASQPERVSTTLDTSGVDKTAAKHILASPAVRDRARALGVDLADVKAQSDRVRHADLDAYLTYNSAQGFRAAGASARRADEPIKVIGMRRRIAENMQASKRNIPHFTYVEEVDVTDLEAMRADLNANRGSRPKLTMLPLLIVAICKAIPDFPMINARYDDEAGVVTRHGSVHLGMATQTDAGLMVPVIRDAQDRNVWQLATEITRLAEAARIGKAKSEELSGSTFTITSLGPLGGVATTPVINRPEVAIIGPNRVIERPMFRGGEIVAAKLMNISISCDHRVVDGWDAASYVQAVRKLLETPVLLFAD
ncbi:dihydrolipoamide acetyltransferase family protein [Sphingobium boeckii]|uniref:Dihydrolipoamide acetyltransferase component of pyruvate dehydrogenase complex n=1 Tax=Sphingobium boeckii TaxID=1082345 RepID=A0A7W9EG93_9SPHN|nr:dihydrolipoamide acetyltransferase family protein [Sphingobium boeckii]MBB5686511.1 2-oxoisovalerate dehydrogenase E2 component (dihydrolipoyl transacylase) [Sphingobium boeckii]